MKLLIVIVFITNSVIVRSVLKETIQTHRICFTKETVSSMGLVCDVKFKVILLCWQIAMLELQALLHCPLIQLFVVLEFGFVAWVCFALVVHEWCAVGNVTIFWLLSHVSISKHMEDLLIIFLHDLDLLLPVVPEVLVGTALTRLVRCVLLCAHGDYFLNPLFHNGALK